MEDETDGVLYNTLYQTGALVEPGQREAIRSLLAGRCIPKTHELSAALLRHHFILDDGEDEDAYAQLIRLNTIAKKSKELTLTIKTTMNCNLKCAYCQYLERQFPIRAVENSRCGVRAALEDVLAYLAEE